MLFGAASVGVRCMSASSGPGISLMQEGLSYLAGAELPCVIADIMRGGPGLGNIAPEQGDYNQIVKGGGHGCYHCLALAPSSVQEMADLTTLAFDLADEYRNPVVVIGDGLIGQMMEPVVFPESAPKTFDRSWAATGKPATRERNIINSLFLDPEVMEKHVQHLFTKVEAMRQKEQRHEDWQLDDKPPVVLCAYGTTARICKTAIRDLRRQGVPVGLFRPITAWPFPYDALKKHLDHAKVFLTVEMSMGQMVEDVRIAVQGKREVKFWGRSGGVVPTVEEIVALVKEHSAR
jgi:pyruvate/2-oxoacid:ferredoxin oxidoreductase alpha subunit